MSTTEVHIHPSWLKRKIIHVDMDCFYASVEELQNPELKGKPVIVGGTHRGVVCAANYEARKFGVHSAMPISRARRLCREGIFLPVRIPIYAEVSKDIHEIFSRYTDLIQPISLDEAYLDVTKPKTNTPSATAVAEEIRSAISNELQLVASAGVGPNKLVAKIASDVDKPNGLTIVPPNRVNAFLKPMPVGRIGGIGRKAQMKLKDLGIDLIGQLAHADEDIMLNHFGRHGLEMIQLAQGIDISPVHPRTKSKSIGRELTYTDPVHDAQDLSKDIHRISEDLAQRLARKELECRTISIKLKRTDFEQFTRSKSLDTPSAAAHVIEQITHQLLLHNVPPELFPLRLFGISCSNITSTKDHLDLFDILENHPAGILDPS